MLRVFFPAIDLVRLFRISWEFVRGFHFFGPVYPMVSIFGSARIPVTHASYELTRQLANRLGKVGFSILTGGGGSFMEAANLGAREAGAPSLACNIRLPFEQRANAFIDKLLTMRFFFTRKYMLISYSVGFVILPGGYGTLDELFEALTLMQTRKIPKRPVILLGREYWQGLEAWLLGPVYASGAIGDESLALFHITDSIDEACEILIRTKNQIDHERKHYPVNREPEKTHVPD